MAKATPGSVSEKERELLTSTEAANLNELDEDALIALHDRVRRARTKHVQLHRRSVGRQVGVKGARGTASLAPRRSASKAEVFEGALARVSTALAKRARESASALRAERLATAQRSTSATPAKRSAAGRTAGSTSTTKANSRSRGHEPVERKTVASGRAAGARRQAKSDGR